MRKKNTIRFLPLTVLFICYQFACSSQIPVHSGYIGSGNHDGIAVRTSSATFRENWSNQADGRSTIDGAGLTAKRMEAARFLAQAGFGGTPAQIEALAHSGDFNLWIETQAAMPGMSMLNAVRSAYTTARNAHGIENSTANYSNTSRHFHYAWWQMMMTQPDVMRQRIAMALSEIIVISTNSTIRNDGEVYASFYDIFLRNAFGNYRDILQEVSLHPAMGVYLTHYRNPKTDTTTNTYPDENYAREVMQLFSIGLFELNMDGSLKLNGNGESIPTYGLDDTRELAKVFTGLGAGALTQQAIDQGRSLNFNTGTNHLNYLMPMAMYDEKHETGEKTIVGGHTIPAGMEGMDDINLALDHLFNHPNVGPFISRKLIQHFVKSNPTNLYISDVAQVFNDNGEGVRGDMKAVMKAILLHDEARACIWQNDPTNGKLKSPVLRYAAFARAVEKVDEKPLYFTEARNFYSNTSHRVLSSPSVFNFYSPNHKPNGPLATMELYGPEFELHNSVTSIGYVNEVDGWTRNGRIFDASELPFDIELDKVSYYEIAQDPDVLINHLDVVLTYGRLKEETKAIIRQALNEIPVGNMETALKQRVEIATYLIMISPEFNVLK
jgi:uncharacterized protein (DUF1800 family)